MVHYTCDLCGQSIEGLRFSVKIEIQRHEPAGFQVPADLDQDFLDQIEDDILKLGSTADFHLPPSSKHTQQKDLCQPCAARFEKDPLAVERSRRFKSSSN